MKFSWIGLAALMAAGAAQAGAAELVTNGGFETLTNGPGELGFNTNGAGWTTTGYNFVFAPGTADTTGSIGSYAALTLWGPNDGSANGLPAASPSGGNFVGADGAFQVGAITQTVGGLTPGAAYDLTFWWAGAQQHGFTGATTEKWDVSLGAQTIDTPVVDNANHGFTGWVQETFRYTATAASETLSFLAVGTPGGEPPFALLDGVSLQAASVPEPNSAMLATAGLTLIGWRTVASRRTRRGRAA